MKAARVAAAFLIAGPIMWLVVASALYCEMSGHMGMFRFPYTQWWQAAPWWRLNWWMTLYVIASAAVPTLIILGALIATIRIGYGRPRDLRCMAARAGPTRPRCANAASPEVRHCRCRSMTSSSARPTMASCCASAARSMSHFMHALDPARRLGSPSRTLRMAGIYGRLDIKGEVSAATAGIVSSPGAGLYICSTHRRMDGRSHRWDPLASVQRQSINRFDQISRQAFLLFPEAPAW